MASREDELAPLEIPGGTMLGKYEVLRRIATGGMAEIYLARVRGQAGFEKLVVIKRILPTSAGNPRLIEMFLDEARLVATLQHPNIADVYEVGEYQGAPFFAMQYVHGQDARAIRKAAAERHEGVPLRVSLAIVHATASALDYAHDRAGADGGNLELVHRDVSPSNILVSYEGAIKLIDFGVARVTSQSHTTQSGTVRGKCPYMSPEQCRGLPIDRRSDLFSLGAVLYELTVGRRPFVGNSDFEIMNEIVNRDAKRPSLLTEGYPPPLEHIVLKLLARDTSKRYQSAEELLHDLEAFLDAHHLWVPPKKLSRYMRKLFGDRLIAWEAATAGDTATFAEHVALAMEPEHRRRGEDTPVTAVPVVMRLAQEIAAVAIDMDASFAQVYRDGDPNDPLKDILAPSDGLDDPSVLHGSIAHALSGETVTVRTSEPPAFETSVALQAGGDSVTVRGSELQDSMVQLSGDTETTPWEGRPDMRAETVRSEHDVVADDTTTMRPELQTITELGVVGPRNAAKPRQSRKLPTKLVDPKALSERTSPGWDAPPGAPSAQGDPDDAAATHLRAKSTPSRGVPRSSTLRTVKPPATQPNGDATTPIRAAGRRYLSVWVLASLLALFAIAVLIMQLQ